MRAILFIIFLLGLSPFIAHSGEDSFKSWLKDFQAEARAAGISDEVLTQAFQGVRPSDEVLELDQTQPERTVTFEDYIARVVSESRVENGRANYQDEQQLLNSIAREYGVPAKYIVSLWGVETSYGNNIGDTSVIESLATLAYDGRRSAFFRTELLAALRMMQEDHIEPDEFLGSWAGAVGQCQFMPSSFLKYAVDYDQDGKRDIWNNRKDVFASIANYLRGYGWDTNKEWGYRVNLPLSRDPSWAAENTVRTWAEWLERGVTLSGRKVKLNGDLRLTLIYPDDAHHHPYLVTSNFDVIMKWNRSQYFAVSVGTLADAIE